MLKKRTVGAATLVAAFVFLRAVPAGADCNPADPGCRLSPVQSRQVNPAAVERSAVAVDLHPTAGSLSTVPLASMPLVTAEQLAAVGRQPSAFNQTQPTSSTGPAEISGLDLTLRRQTAAADDVSCGVLALGMALDGLAGTAPSSSAMLEFLEQQGMVYEWGTGVEELAYAAAHFGYDGARPFHAGSIEDLQAELAAGRPVLVALGANGSDRRGHFVTVSGISAGGGWLRYQDPQLGEQTIPYDQFEALWARQGHSGVHFGGGADAGGGAPSALPWLALAAGLMALVSQTELVNRRKGIGGKLMKGGGSVDAASRPPYPAPVGKRWRAQLVPTYETRTVQRGWTTVSERVPVMAKKRVQVGTRTYYERVPRTKTVWVQQGWERYAVRVPTYKTITTVRGYTYRTRRYPTAHGWRTVRTRVPLYGSRRVRSGTRTEWRQRPHYVTKDVPDGFELVKQTQPVYEWREQQVGWQTIEKHVPRMVTQRVPTGNRLEWKLEAVPAGRDPAPTATAGPTPRPQPIPTPEATSTPIAPDARARSVSTSNRFVDAIKLAGWILLGKSYLSEMHQESHEVILDQLSGIDSTPKDPFEEALRGRIIQDYRAAELSSGSDRQAQYGAFLDAYNACFDLERPRSCMDALALELYRREGVDLDTLASQKKNNPLRIDEVPELELLTPAFNLEWADSTNSVFLSELGLDPFQFSNYEPDFFNELKTTYPNTFRDIANFVADEEEDREALEKILGSRPKAGLGLPDFTGIPPESE